jgi:dipeptidyl aminopeptidase/acylaminoacyl peptidase
LKYVLATADYCQTLPWADAGHIGICGQSFGGFETNYIVTHTKRFAAAISNSGVSDAILDYLSLWNEGSDKIDYMEKGQGRMDKTLWEDPARYLENSPLLSANKIVTPLFMVANRKDGNVSYMNGQELF